MNKADLVNSVADGADLSKGQASAALDAMLDAITATLAGGEKVSIAGFGNFDVSHRAARTGRNPQTGAEIQIAARNVVRFKPGKPLREAV